MCRESESRDRAERLDETDVDEVLAYLYGPCEISDDVALSTVDDVDIDS